MTSTAITTTAVRVGNGTAVHVAVTNAQGGVSYTVCGSEGRGYRQSRLRRTTEAVTCQTCRPGATAAPAEDAHPATCPQHGQAGGTDRIIKAGDKRTYACGCTHLIPA